MSNTENKDASSEAQDQTVDTNESTDAKTALEEQTASEIEGVESAEESIESAAETVDVTIESLQVEIETQQAQFTDQLLRVKAEMENVRRRSDKQVADSRKYANEAMAKELVTVRDSLQIASETEIEADDSDAVKSMREGLGLTLKQLDSLFEKFSIAEISPEPGDKLDPNLHQAMTMVPSDEVAPGTVVNTIQRGYQLHDRLLRPAMVVVAQK